MGTLNLALVVVVSKKQPNKIKFNACEVYAFIQRLLLATNMGHAHIFLQNEQTILLTID
jgi:hypothetical protein